MYNLLQIRKKRNSNYGRRGICRRHYRPSILTFEAVSIQNGVRLKCQFHLKTRQSQSLFYRIFVKMIRWIDQTIGLEKPDNTYGNIPLSFQSNLKN